MKKLRMKFYQFMIGRNGVDQLGQATVGVGLVFYVLHILTSEGIFNGLSTVALLYALYRMLSKNIMARSAENRIFLRYVQLVQKKWEFRKTHKVFLCRKCGRIVRVPKGKGRIEVTCPGCRTTVVIRS